MIRDMLPSRVVANQYAFVLSINCAKYDVFMASNIQYGGFMSAQPVDIQIFGRSMRVNCPSEQKEALLESAKELEQRLQNLKDKSGVTNMEQLIFIVALNVCHELAQEKTKTRDYAYNMEEKIKMLQHTIEQALHDQVKITERQVLPLE